MKIVKIMIAACLLGGMLQPLAFSKVTLQPNYEGTVMLTGPEGKVSMLGLGDKTPEISSESRLEVFDGRISVSTEEGDRAVAACSGNEALLGGGASVELLCKNKEKEGLLKVLGGEVLLKDFEGKSITLKKGAVQKLNLAAFEAQGLKAPATAAGQELGTPVNSGVHSVDSRSIESSPTR